MPNANLFRGITTEARTTRCAPMRLETVVDLCSDPNNIIRGARYEDIVPPQDREAFMNWYFARRIECSRGISSRDMQAAEEVWRFVSGEPDDLIERTERDQLWRRTYINAMARRKGNAVAAVVITCS